MPTKAKIKTDATVPVKVTEITDSNGNTRQTKVYETEADIIDTAAEIDDNSENFDDESEIEDFTKSDFQEIPKNQLMQMFDDLRLLSANPNDYFYAMASRIPDAMADSFNIRCNSEQAPIHFQFTIRDLLAFTENLQKVNNNSGGRFNIAILAPNMTPLKIPLNPYSTRSNFREVGLINFYVPNPQITIDLNPNGQPQTNGLENLVTKLIEHQQNQTNQILNAIQQNNKPREKSTLESAIEQKILNDILNPPEKSNGFEQTMMSIMAMPVMVEKMSAKIFPETPKPQPEREPTLIEQAAQIMQTPFAQNLSESLGNAVVDLSETYKIAKMNQLGVKPQLNPANEQVIETEQENDFNMLNEIITELESDSVIALDNPLLQKLASEHQKEFNELTSYCQIMNFNQLWTMLQMQSQKLTDNPLIRFANIEETQKQKQLVLNEQGEKVFARLKELYKLLNPNWLQMNPNL